MLTGNGSKVAVPQTGNQCGREVGIKKLEERKLGDWEDWILALVWILAFYIERNERLYKVQNKAIAQFEFF